MELTNNSLRFNCPLLAESNELNLKHTQQSNDDDDDDIPKIEKKISHTQVS